MPVGPPPLRSLRTDCPATITLSGLLADELHGVCMHLLLHSLATAPSRALFGRLHAPFRHVLASTVAASSDGTTKPG